MGIKNEFHQQTILASIKDLLTSAEKPIQSGVTVRTTSGGVVFGMTGLDEAGAGTGDVATADKHSQHDLVDHSFSKLVKCDKCQQYLRGLIHQGLLCKQCNLIVHRQCSATGGLKPCGPTSSSSLMATSTATSTSAPSRIQQVFGLGLCQQFNAVELPAPQIVIILCNELEQKAMCDMNLDLYKLYRTTPPNYDEVNKLRDSLNENLINTDLSAFSPECVATVLKKFLRELPDPIIPVMFYDKFVETSSKSVPKPLANPTLILIFFLPPTNNRDRERRGGGEAAAGVHPRSAHPPQHDAQVHHDPPDTNLSNAVPAGPEGAAHDTDTSLVPYPDAAAVGEDCVSTNFPLHSFL